MESPVPMEGTGERTMDDTEHKAAINDVDVSANALELQRRLECLRVSLLKAKATFAASQRDKAGDEEELYGGEERLGVLTKERTLAFLNFSILRDAMQGAQANVTLTQALGLEKDGNIKLQEEEIQYVRGLLEEKGELSAELFRQQKVGEETELELVTTRAELARLHCETKEMLEEVKEIRVGAAGSEDQQSRRLKEQLKEGDLRLNQIRFVLQKFMLAYDKLGQLFSAERNSELEELFLRCGRSPRELREELMASGEVREAPAAAADLRN